MANWSHIRATSILGPDLRQVASSGSKFYYVDDATEDIYEYDPATDTETLILDASAITDYSNTYAIAWFKGDLYVLNDYTGNPLVQRWDGTPNDFTTVRTFSISGGPTQTGMIADGTTLVAFTVSNPASPAPFSAECWYSADGSSWSAGSWDSSVWSPPDLNGVFDPFKATDFPIGLWREFVTTTDAGRTTTTQKSIFQFVAGTWVNTAILNTAPAEIYRHSSPNENVHWAYTVGRYYNSDFSSFTNIGGSPPQVYQINMPFSVAVDLSPPQSLYQFEAGAWAVLDAFDEDWDFSADINVIRLDSGDVYIMAYASIGLGYDVRIFGRDEPIITSCVNAQFYYGIEVPQYTSDLPFCGVRPGAMAIAAQTGLVVLGSDARSEAGPSVVWGQYPYTAEWTDISGIVPTGTAVTSIKFL